MAATLGELKAALVNADKAGDVYSARRLAAAVTHMQDNKLELYEAPQPKPGLVDNAVEAVTGDRRKTKTTESLPDWAGMPELNTLSLASAKTGVGTLLSSPKETAEIIKANFPQAQVRKDEKGNWVIKSSMDGQEYAIKPGFQVSDIPRTIAALAAFTPAGRATTIPGAAAAAAGTQAVIEGSQAATGGEFNPGEVLTAGAGGAVVPAVVKAVQAVKAPVKAAIENAMGAPASGAPAAAAPAAVVPPVAPVPVAPVVPPVAMAAPELAATAKTAAEGGLGSKNATSVLAEQAMPDPKTVEAAQRLGIQDYLQPDHVTTNQAYKELAQAVKSIPGSEARAAEVEGLNAVGKRADDLITEIGGSTDVSALDASVKGRLKTTQTNLENKAEELFGKLRATIPAQTEAPATSVLEFLEKRAADLGGKENLSSAEKTILKKLSPKEVEVTGPNVPGVLKGPDDKPLLVYHYTNAEIGAKDLKLGAAEHPHGEGIWFTGRKHEQGEFAGRKNEVPAYIKMDKPYRTVKQYEVEEGLADPEFVAKMKKGGYDGIVYMDPKNATKSDGGRDMSQFVVFDPKQILEVPKGSKQPTYALLDDVRRDLGTAGKMTGPFKDADAGLAKKLYGLLSDDQGVVAEAHGAADLWKAAKGVVQIRKGVEDDLQALFSKAVDGSIVGDLSGAVNALPKGDVSKLVNLIKMIPEEMRAETMATGLKTAFGKQTQNGSLNFNTYSKWYEGLLQNKQAYAAVMSNLPSGARKQLSDLYRVSKAVSSATRERITTGRIMAVKDELQGPDTLVANLYGLAKRSSIGLAAEAVTAPLGIHGAGIAAGVASALTKGKPNALKAVDALVASPEFAEAVKQASTGQARPAAARLAYSKPFTKFVRAVGNPKELSNRERWILQTLEAQNQAGERK